MSSRGSALIMAMFVLVLLTGMGTALLFLSQHEMRMGRAGLRAKQAFYLAEAGVEDGRATLFAVNGEEEFDDDLETAAGADDELDLDPAAIQPVYDSDGNVTGFTGVDDDVPLRPLTALGGSSDLGWYAAYLSNDPVEDIWELDDQNERVMITGVGAGPGGSFEVVQAIVEPFTLLPEVPAAALTLLGPSPVYDNGSSNAQSHSGDDCGIPGGAFAPIVGTVSSDANAATITGASRLDAAHFNSGTFSGEDTFADLTNPAEPIVAGAGHGTIAPVWTDCEALKAMVEQLALAADYYCNTDVSSCSFPVTSPDSIVFIDGDLSNTPSGANSGVLVVTGQLTYSGNSGWDGIVLVIGEGSLLRNGGGGGSPSGAVVLANIDPTPAGPRADKSDWCSTDPDGFGQVSYHTNGGGNSDVQWCTDHINDSNPVRYYRVTEFLQR